MNALPFEVDRFEVRGGRTAVPRFTLCTHAHADHLSGLSIASFPPVYCTKATAAIASLRTGAPNTRFRHLPLNQATKIYADDNVEELVATVTALSANHCLGAAIFIIDGPFGRILHTGDFRNSPELARSIRPYAGTVDLLLLDCTYCHPSFVFPSQAQGILQIVSVVAKTWCRGLGDDVFIGGDTLGKEELYIEIAMACQTRIRVGHDRYATIVAAHPVAASTFFLPPPPNSSRSHVLSKVHAAPKDGSGRRELSAIHVVPWWAVTKKSLASWTTRRRRRVTVLLPTACPSRLGLDSPGVRVLYSSHSSYSELRDFVRILRPSRVGSTPETAHYTAKDGLCRDPSMWFADLLPQSDTAVKSASPYEQFSLPSATQRVLIPTSLKNVCVSPTSKKMYKVSGSREVTLTYSNRGIECGRRVDVYDRWRMDSDARPSRKVLQLMSPGLDLPVANSQLKKRERSPHVKQLHFVSSVEQRPHLCSKVLRQTVSRQRLYSLQAFDLVDKMGNAIAARRDSQWF